MMIILRMAKSNWNSILGISISCRLPYTVYGNGTLAKVLFPVLAEVNITVNAVFDNVAMGEVLIGKKQSPLKNCWILMIMRKKVLIGYKFTQSTLSFPQKQIRICGYFLSLRHGQVRSVRISYLRFEQVPPVRYLAGLILFSDCVP